MRDWLIIVLIELQSDTISSTHGAHGLEKLQAILKNGHWGYKKYL